MTAIGISVLGVCLIFLYQTVRTPVSQVERLLVVTPGMGATELAERLVSQNFAGSEWPIVAWAVLSGTAGSFKSGEYLIPINTSPAQILGKVSRGDVHQRRVTLIEGLRFSQVRERLARKKKLEPDAALMSEEALLNTLSLEPASLEGRFFPSCLLYTSPSPRDATLSRMPSSA